MAEFPTPVRNIDEDAGEGLRRAYENTASNRGLRERVASDLNENIGKIMDNRYVRMVNRAKTAAAIFSAIAPALPFIIVGVVVIFVVSQFLSKPGVDIFDLAVQCQIAGQPTDERCLQYLYEKTGDLIAPKEESKGGINNPNQTFPN